MGAISRNVGDRRRTDELDKLTRKVAKFKAVPDKKHLRDGEVAMIEKTGQLVWRDGDNVYVLDGTIV